MGIREQQRIAVHAAVFHFCPLHSSVIARTLDIPIVLH